MKKTHISGKWIGLCPCCQNNLYADAHVGAIVHDFPPCGKFKELDPLDFIRYVRRSRGIPDAATEHTQ
jgi:hypothetical protein